MLDGSDVAFATALERSILRTLHGDKDKEKGPPGLYHTLRSVPSWEMFQRTAGLIQGYENILEEMRRIARIMNGEPEPPPQQAPHPRVN